MPFTSIGSQGMATLRTAFGGNVVEFGKAPYDIPNPYIANVFIYFPDQFEETSNGKIPKIDTQELKALMSVTDFSRSSSGVGPWDSNPGAMVQSFRFKRITGGIGQFTIKLFDPSWTKFERQLLKSNGIIVFQYGYFSTLNTGKEKISPAYVGQVTNYSYDFALGGVTLTLTGLSTGYELAFYKKFVGIEKIEDREKFSLGEFLEKYIKDAGYEPVIEKPLLTALDVGGLTNTDKYDLVLGQIGNASSLQMILQTLTKFVFNKEKQGPYIFYLKQRKDGKKEVHFHTPTSTLADSDTIPVFTIMHTAQSPVIDFKPASNISIVNLLGGVKTSATIIDKFTKQEKTVNADQNNSNQKPIGAADQACPAVPVNLTESYNSVITAADTIQQAQAEVDNIFGQKFYSALKCSLTIQGTLAIDLLDKIYVHLFIPKGPDAGKIHPFLSDVYRVFNIEDIIEMGKFITNLEIVASGMASGTDKQSSKVSPDK